MSIISDRKRKGNKKITDFLDLPISPQQHKQLLNIADQQRNYPDEMSICANAINSTTPLIRALVIRIANYPDRLRRQGKSVQNSTKLTRPGNYRLSDQVQYSVMASRTPNQAWSTQVHTVNSNIRTSKIKCSLFSKKNPIIRILYTSGWLAIPINRCKWRSTVFKRQADKTNGAVHLTFASTRLVYPQLPTSE